jgi:hypothetical protein
LSKKPPINRQNFKNSSRDYMKLEEMSPLLF